MMDGALSRLPIDAPRKGAFASIIKQNSKPAKPVCTIPKMKAVAKLAEKLGKTVTAITVNGDGGFTVVTLEPEKAEEAEWWNKKVFGNDPS